jgi:hypothetical protein
MVVGRFLLPKFFLPPETFFLSPSFQQLPFLLGCYSKDGGMLLRPCPAALFACIYSTARPAVMRASSPHKHPGFLLPIPHLNAFAFSPFKCIDAPNKSRITYYPISY